MESIAVAHNGRVVEMHVANAALAGIFSLFSAVSSLILRQARRLQANMDKRDTAIDDDSAVSR
ncbi:hypothetical protein J2T57_000742 [Natronocella acetinitrilica]|uniref:Uncharacterized protein n=1 Tax=Natronocella acetinitrilica TaxID=414046 RepID=A0AAE3G1V4_9GAMM|nr:hypothetical protein [Natronocella acetinitrilica]MCP1673643.1 hypothetical protein [Natronocella acetinitrilica]